MSEAPRNETQATISEWATATFGDGGTDLHAALRCLDEAVEALEAIWVNDRIDLWQTKVAEEVADVFITAARLGVRLDEVTLLSPPPATKGYVDVTDSRRSVSELVGTVGRIVGALRRAEMAPEAEKITWHHTARALTGCLFNMFPRVGQHLGVDLQEHVNRKMQINRARTYPQGCTCEGSTCKRAWWAAGRPRTTP